MGGGALIGRDERRPSRGRACPEKCLVRSRRAANISFKKIVRKPAFARPKGRRFWRSRASIAPHGLRFSRRRASNASVPGNHVARTPQTHQRFASRRKPRSCANQCRSREDVGQGAVTAALRPGLSNHFWSQVKPGQRDLSCPAQHAAAGRAERQLPCELCHSIAARSAD